jgi:hypothetical protein
MPNTDSEQPVELAANANNDDKRDEVAVTARGSAKAKSARLRLLKERNESYLAEQRDEGAEEEVTKELRVSNAE